MNEEDLSLSPDQIYADERLTTQMVSYDEIERGQRGLYLKLHSAAIHIEHVMSLLARKGWLYLLYHAYNRLQTEEIHQITLKELKEKIGFDNTHNNKHIIEALMSLRRSEVNFNIFGKDGVKWKGNTSLLSEFRISEEKDGLLLYAFPPFLRERLFNPSIYTMLSLAVSREFKSKHSLAIYMMAVDYIFKERNEGLKRLQLDELRRYLGLKDNQYRLGGDMVRLMKSAEKEINDDSDISITITPEKVSRKVSSFLFRMSFKESAESHKALPPSLDAQVAATKKRQPAFRLAELDAFAQEHGVNLQNRTLKKLLLDLTKAHPQATVEAYLQAVIKDINRRLRLPERDGIQDVARIFVHYLREEILLEPFLGKQAQETQTATDLEQEIAAAMEKLLDQLYHKQLERDFKSYILAQADQGLLSNEAFEEELVLVLPSQLLTTYRQRSGGKLTPQMLSKAPAAVQALLKEDKTFGFAPVDPLEWKLTFVKSTEGKAHALRIEREVRTKHHLPI